MAIPTGSGTEVLKRSIIDGLGTSEQTLITGVANHIYTIISILVAQKNSSATTFTLYVDPSAGGTDMHILNAHSLPGNSHFVWNDKFVLTATDSSNRQVLRALSESAGDFDYHTSYIVQDWT